MEVVRKIKRATLVTKVVLLWLTLLGASHQMCGSDASTVIVPAFGDKYSSFVKQLEAGQTDINYREFRQSFLDSEQFGNAAKQKPDLGTLRKQMHALMQQSKYAQIIAVAKQMLSLDYTDMEAHKILQQTYKILGDTANRNKYHDIEFGLLNSIVKNGDGKTCHTAWPVVQITEEYFILQMLGAKLLRQSVDNAGGLCDKMEVQTNDGNKTYYFEVSKVFDEYRKHGIR